MQTALLKRGKSELPMIFVRSILLLNHYAELLGHPYDKGGQMAASGALDSDLLDALNGLSFYSEPPPKSLGLEWVTGKYSLCCRLRIVQSENILHTYTEHVAQQLAMQFRDGCPLFW